MPVAMEISFTCRARSHSQAWFGYYTQVGTSLEVHRHLVELESTFSGQPGRHSAPTLRMCPARRGAGTKTMGCWHPWPPMEQAQHLGDGAGGESTGVKAAC
jgi:hypothetical protein